jgi:hypothetical protein
MFLSLASFSRSAHGGLVAEILPPMGNFGGLGDYVAGLVHDGR